MAPSLKLAHLYRRLPLILAHRGASAIAPENTLAAFQLALEQGADGVELDVTLSADGVPVVIHDDTLDRTTTGRGPVSRMSLADLQKLDAGYPARFAGRFSGVRLPSLSEVFEACAAPAIINVELKRDRSPGLQLARHVVELIHAHGCSDRVLLSSFQVSSLGRVKALDPILPVGLLYRAPWLGPRLARCLPSRLPLEAHHPAAMGLSALDIAWYHQRGLRVNTWTVDDPRAMQRLAIAGVDGLITNRPDLAVSMRSAMG